MTASLVRLTRPGETRCHGCAVHWLLFEMAWFATRRCGDRSLKSGVLILKTSPGLKYQGYKNHVEISNVPNEMDFSAVFDRAVDGLAGGQCGLR